MTVKEYRPTLAQLRTFVTIAEQKHFGAAAAKLNISQPSLSQALTALENGLGIHLIERSTRRVLVTPAGVDLLPYAKATLDAAEAFYTHAAGSDGDLTGVLTIGIIPTIAPYILPTALALLHDEYPQLVPRIIEDHTHNLEELLRDGKADVILIALPTDSSGFIKRPLYDERFVCVTPADDPLGGRTDLVLSDLQDTQLLLLAKGNCLRDQVVNLCKAGEANQATVNPVTRATSLTTVVQCVAAGMGTSIIPESALLIEAHHPGTAYSYFTDSVTAGRTVGLVYRTSTTRSSEFDRLGEILTRAFDTTIATIHAAAK
ncbi:MAG: hydrogen peroxide-inducible genes activator [Corynebacterium sp.]|nr:hydrogen peroxide-inducible genes activator [Corynebacterium sp.]